MSGKRYKLLNLVSWPLIGLLTYDMAYRVTHQLKNNYEDELFLDELEITNIHDLNWINAEGIESQMNLEIIPLIKKFLYKGKVKSNEILLDYSLFLIDKQLPTVIIVHGLNEFQEKYYELSYYFLQMGYNVLVYDQRDHGQSRSNIDDTLINTISFNSYVLDLKNMIDTISSQYSLLESYFVFGHSMGGAVVTSFLEDYDYDIKAVVLTSPMLNIDTDPYSQSIAYLFSTGAKFLGLGDNAIPSQASNKVFDSNQSDNIFTMNYELTSSEGRRYYSIRVNNSINKPYTTDSTMNWLNTSMKQLNSIVKEDKLASIKEKTLIFRSVDDKIVNPKGIFQAANYIPNSILVSVRHSGHEIYQERDTILRDYVRLISHFFRENQ